MTGEERSMLKQLISDVRLARVEAHRVDPTDECDYCGERLPEEAQVNRRFCNKSCSYLFSKRGVLA